MTRVILINVINEGESRIAIIHGELLEELSIETASHEQIEGNIYKAKIVKIIPGLGATFVEYGAARNGFLSLSDIRPEYFADGRKDPSCLRKGQELLVQVKKGEIGQKGAALTTYASIPGRYLVFMPYVDKRGVSRKIEDDGARKQLLDVLEEIGVPPTMGYIARTAAMDQKKQDLSRDASYLMRLWKRIQTEYESAKAPHLLYQESDVVIRTIRDYFSPSVSEVWVDDEAVCTQVKSFFRAVMPWNQKKVKFYQGKAPLFSKYNLEQQIAAISGKTVPLPSGGSIVIEQTEALVSVDVNSGRSNQGKDIEETAFLTNQEAAAEVARQLRLRDMGGLIVIDFIDMRNPARRNELKKTLQKSLKEDKARTDIGSVSKFGLIELSRQRIKPSSGKGLSSQCPLCEGRGKIQSVESSAISVLRMVQSRLAGKKSYNQILIGVSTDAAIFLLNRQRNKILSLEEEFNASIAILAENVLQSNQYYIEFRSDDGTHVELNLPADFPKNILKTPKGLPGGALPPRQPKIVAAEPTEPVKIAETSPPAQEEKAEPTIQAEAPQRNRRRRRRKPKTNGMARAAATADTTETAAGEPDGQSLKTIEDKPESQPAEAKASEESPAASSPEKTLPVAKKLLNWVAGKGKQTQKIAEKSETIETSQKDAGEQETQAESPKKETLDAAPPATTEEAKQTKPSAEVTEEKALDPEASAPAVNAQQTKPSRRPARRPPRRKPAANKKPQATARVEQSNIQAKKTSEKDLPDIETKTQSAEKKEIEPPKPAKKPRRRPPRKRPATKSGPNEKEADNQKAAVSGTENGNENTGV